MSAVFLKVLNMSITAGWLILAVLAARLLLKKAPKWVACLLWTLVAVRLICPFSPESVLSLIPSREAIPANIALSREPAVNTGIPIVNAAVNPVLAESFAPDPAAGANPLQIVIPIAAAVWVTGTAAMLVYALVSYWKLKKSVYCAAPVRDRILACDEIEAPFILGVFRPTVYVPSSMAGQTLDCVIRHETAHLERRDHWWKPLGFLLLAVYWFHPLCWLAYILLCRDIEMACDERVIRDADRETAAAYSQALLDCSAPRRRITACPLAFGEVGVKERIKGVLHYKKPAFWILLAAIAVCAVLLVCFLTDPRAPSAAADPFGKAYRVEEIVCEPVADASRYTAESAPRYRITGEGKLWIRESGAADWLYAGVFEEVELTKDSFDRYFRDRGIADNLRRGNGKAWRLIQTGSPDAEFYDLLVQKTGEVYLACGYYDASEKGDPDSDDTAVRWVFCLVLDERGETDLEILRRSYPEYFDLQTGKGLEVYVWQMAPDSYSWGVMAGTNRNKTNEELWNLRGTTLDEMRMILSTYDLPESDIIVIPLYKPISSYYYATDEAYAGRMREMLFGDRAAPAGVSAGAEGAGADAPYVPDEDPIGKLFETILSSPAYSSNPGDYLRAHEEEHQQLLDNGPAALRYIFSEFLYGNRTGAGQTGLKGHLMRLILDELAPEAALDLAAPTGQAYFDAWLERAEQLQAAHGDAWMEANQPAMYLLLQMTEE